MSGGSRRCSSSSCTWQQCWQQHSSSATRDASCPAAAQQAPSPPPAAPRPRSPSQRGIATAAAASGNAPGRLLHPGAATATAVVARNLNIAATHLLRSYSSPSSGRIRHLNASSFSSDLCVTDRSGSGSSRPRGLDGRRVHAAHGNRACMLVAWLACMAHDHAWLHGHLVSGTDANASHGHRCNQLIYLDRCSQVSSSPPCQYY